MIPKVVLALLIGICAVVCFAKPMEHDQEDLSWNEFAKMLSNIPDDEKYKFVKSHVLKGYKLSQQDVSFEELDEDSKLSLSVFNVVKRRSDNIEKDRGLLQRNSQICFQPPIGCIDSGDSGVRPM